MKNNRYERLLKDNDGQLQALTQKHNTISGVRLVTAVAMLVSLMMGFFQGQRIGYIAGIALIGIFLLLVRQHTKLEKEQQYLQARKAVLEQYLARFSEQWREFANDGKEYIKEDYPPARDLDLLGRDSLYQYICVAHTKYGKQNLAERLQNQSPKGEDILPMQGAVEELGKKGRFSIHVQALSKMMTKQKKSKSDDIIENFIQRVEGEQMNRSAGRTIRMWALPGYTLGCLALAVAGVPIAMPLATLGMVAQLSLSAMDRQKNERVLDPIYFFSRNINLYQQMFEAMEEERFTSPYLKQLQKGINGQGGAVQGLKQLESISGWVNVRYNGVGYFLCSSFLMWDDHCIRRFSRWSNEYGADMRQWLKIVGELEALLSLAVLCEINEQYSFPKIVEQESPTLKVQKVRHPLIKEEIAIANSIQLQGQTCIITGSNMSGKTTFLRSIGTNLALAYAGGPVLAEGFEASEMAIFTSMRVEDSVSNGLSTFYAELLRIKTMVDYSKEQLPMITLIDEIFKGTNSKDRIIGATETIKRLSNPWAITMVTTHDFELCSLEQERKLNAKNYHFEEHYVDNEIRFDYQIKGGRSKTTNAQHLLRMVGIIEEQ